MTPELFYIATFLLNISLLLALFYCTYLITWLAWPRGIFPSFSNTAKGTFPSKSGHEQIAHVNGSYFADNAHPRSSSRNSRNVPPTYQPRHARSGPLLLPPNSPSIRRNDTRCESNRKDKEDIAKERGSAGVAAPHGCEVRSGGEATLGGEEGGGSK